MISPPDPKILRERLEGETPIPLTFRAMFGGFVAYADGRPVVVISRGIGIKLPPEGRAEAIALGGEMLRHDPDGPASKSYVVLPEETPLGPWIARAAEHAATTPIKRRR